MQSEHHKTATSLVHKSWIRGALTCIAVPALVACPVNSTSVDDADLIAQILVQNDNGSGRVRVDFGFSDAAGRNKVDLTADETISYEFNGTGQELPQTGDGEYSINLPVVTPGWYTFTLLRASADGDNIYREISSNFTYLPNSFESVQAATAQSGEVLNVSWIADEETQYLIDDFAVTGSDDSFNAIAACTSRDNNFDVVVTDASINTRDGISTLNIPVAAHLSQVLNMSAPEIAAASCDFDVQLVRTIVGSTDPTLDSRSTATGQVLTNLSIQWAGQ